MSSNTGLLLLDPGGIGCRRKCAQRDALPFDRLRAGMPFGAVRDDVGTLSQTDFTYTFQRNLPDVGLMDYRARFYSPYLNHMTQPDTIIPDPANSQDWNRYSYARNNPIRYTDPSGHSVDCGIGDAYCQAGEYTPAGLMNLYRDNWRTRPETYDDKGLSEDLENYLEEHPNYEPDKDIRWRGNNRNNFTYIRQKYWRDRLIESGVCAKLSVCSEAANLVRHYDFNERFTTIIWNSSQNTSGYVLSDLAGIALGLVGKGPLEISKRGKEFLGLLSIVNSGAAGGTAYYQEEHDTLGVWLAVLSIYPPTSPFVSTVSLGRDLGNGFHEIEYVPSIPR